MKQLLIIRHAKSSWALENQADFDRPLNDRGMRDAPMMAQRLLDKKITIDAFVTSSAKRALTTATFFADAYNAKDKLVVVDKLYHALPAVFFDVLSNLENTIETVAVFAHNPGITAFANHLTLTQTDNMPTCAVFGVKIDAVDWTGFEKAEKSFWFFDYPKA